MPSGGGHIINPIAWPTLRPDQDLRLEVAKDYAEASQGVLKGVQVKNTADAITTDTQSVVLGRMGT